MKMKRLMMLVCVAALTACVFCVPTYAASGDVAGAIEEPGIQHPNRLKQL